jgi:hypothetical protein
VLLVHIKVLPPLCNGRVVGGGVDRWGAERGINAVETDPGNVVRLDLGASGG